MNNDLLSIKEVAELIKVSTKTLRRWEKRGIISPQRTTGNQRRYSREQIEAFLGKKPNGSITEKYIPIFQQEPVEVNFQEKPKLSLTKAQKTIIFGGVSLFFVLLTTASLVKSGAGNNLIGFFSKNTDKNHSQKQLAEDASKVLGANTETGGFIFNVNVPSKFAENAEFMKGLVIQGKSLILGGLDTQNSDIDVGSGKITASNVLYSLTGGNGISLTEGQNPIITNTDLGSSQKIFKTIKIGDTSFSAGSNSDTLTLAEGTNVSLSMDTTNKKVTINSSNTNTSGWTDDGTTVRLSTLTDKVGIGTSNPSSTLDVTGTFGVSGAASMSSTLSVLGGTTIAPASNGNTTSLTVRAANNSTGNILDITNTSGSTSFLSISNNGSLTVGGSTLTNAGLLESSGAIHLTNASNTIVGTAILGGWTMNTNAYTYRRAVIVTNTSGSTLPKNYQISVNLSTSASNQVYTNSQTASPYNDFRIAWDNGGSITETARNVTSFTSSNVSFAFQLQGNISAGATDTYYIYYSNSSLATIPAAYSSYTGDTQLDSADSITNWATGDSANYALSLETTIKQEGTGSLKSAALTGNIGTLATTNQGQLPQTLKKLSAIKASISGSDYLYVLGGNNGTSDQTTAYKATIDGSGNIGTLSTTSQGQLPQALSGHAAVSVVQSVDSGTGTDGTLDLSLGGGAGGCNGTGLSWSAGTNTCTITQATKSTFNFTSINIPLGKTLTVSGSAYAPITLKATGSVTVAGAISYYDGNLTILTSGAVSISGSIITNGYNGFNDDCDTQPATPGDNAGPITIKSTNAITNTGTVSANGGNGGNGVCSSNGANGGNGGTMILWDSDGVITGTFTVTGGTGGNRSSGSFSNGLPGSAGTVTKSSSSVPPYIYVMGGINGATRQSTVYKSSITGSDLGAFSTASQGQLPVALNNLSANAVTISNVNYLYVLGGNNGTADQTAVYKSTVDSSDNLGAFSTASQGQLPQALSQQSSIIVSVGGTNYIYVLGGINGATAQSTVYKATIDGSGNIGTLSTTSQTQLPTAIYDAFSFTATVGTTNYIYLVGGKNSAGNPVNTIYRGTLDASGNVTAWTASGTLPQSISSSAVITSSAGGSNSLYLIGGANPSAISTIYKALINDMSGFTLTKTLSSAVDLSNKNNIQFGFYASQTGSYNAFEFSEDNSAWTQCANNSDFSSGNFSISSANTWETKTCDISSVSNASKNAVLYFRTRVSANQTADFTTYIDNVQALMNAATISNTSAFLSAVLGASDLNLNAQGSGVVKVNYDATNGLAGTGGLIVYNGSSSALLTIGSTGTVTLTGDMISPLTGVAGYWQRGSGVISPTNIADDLLIGGTATTSAKFSVSGIATNKPIASLSGQLLVYPNNGWGGMVGINTLSPTAYLDVAGTASLGGQLTFRSGVAQVQSTADQTLTIGGDTTGQVVLSGFNGALNGIKFAGYTTAGCTLKTTTTGVVQCGTDNTGVNWWNQLAGALLPVDITNDFLLGGQSTASAKFSITGIVTNKPIASLSGNLIVMSNNGWGGNVAIGATTPNFRLDVTDLQNATVSAMITNSSTNANAGALALKVGNTTPALTNYFTSFLNGNGAIVGKIQGNGSGGVTYSTSGVDFAEYFKKENSSEILNPGDIVCLGVTGGATKCIYNNNILGVISDKAGFIGGGEHDQDPNYVAVGLVGQLKVNVSSESGQINPGDSLTVDSRGFATKANTSGQIVGQALESYSGQESNAILVRINITWYQPAIDTTAFLNSAVNATLSASFASTDTLDIQNATISSLMVLGKATVSDLGVTGKINSGLLVLNGLDDGVVDTGATINTLIGDLYLQNQGLGGVNILSGKVTIDTSGNINIAGVLAAEAVKTKNLIIKGSGSVGSATLPAGQTQVQISTANMQSTSKVFITPTTLTSVPLSVTTKANGSFIVKIQAAQALDIKFDWWIVGTE